MSKRIILVAAAMFGIVGAMAAPAAAAIIYNVDQTIGGGSVVGTITTDGALGVLDTADITAWNLELNGVGASYTLTSGIPGMVENDRGADLTATAQDLYFNFSGTDNGRLLFQDGGEDGQLYYCNATQTDDCYAGKTVTPQTIGDPSAQNVPATGNQIIGVAAGVPEPAMWAMFLIGFGAIGWTLRARRSATAATA
jgi:hypothetical protein